MAPTTRVLLTGFAHDELQPLLASLEALALTVHHVPWCDAALELVLEQPYGVIVVRVPTEGAQFARFLSAVRAPSGRCRTCGVVLVAAAGCEDRARQLLGHGVNRVVTEGAPALGLTDAVVELLEVAPRYPVRVPTRIRLEQTERRSSLLCHTTNISASGMLVSGFGNYPVGALLAFELDLPGLDRPLCGAARITRRSNRSREGVTGFGARFEAFAGTDRLRLEEFLSSCQH